MTDFSPQAPPVVHVTNIGCKSTEAKSEKKSLKENFKSRRIRHQKKVAGGNHHVGPTEPTPAKYKTLQSDLSLPEKAPAQYKTL